MSGPARTLDAALKREIIALVSAGVSKTLCAQFVGCSVSTIYRERRRDAQFRRDMERGAAQNILWLKQTMRRHAEKSWRAAAWLLEREYPPLYAPRATTDISGEDLQEYIESWWDLVDKCPFKEAKDWINRHAGRLARNTRRFAAAQATPWERDSRPHSTDLDEVTDTFEPEDVVDDEEIIDDCDESLSDDEDIDLDRDLEDERLRQEAITPPERSRWPHDRKFTYRDAQGVLHHLDMDDPLPHPNGGYYDMERFRDAVEFAKPCPNPMSSAWVHYCLEEGIGPEEKARLEAEECERAKTRRHPEPWLPPPPDS